MAFVDMTVSVRPCDLDIGSEYLNLNHIVRVRLEPDWSQSGSWSGKVTVWFAYGKAESFKGSKAEIIARWYRQNSVIPDEEEELIGE